MSFFNDGAVISNKIKINNVAMPLPSVPAMVEFNNISDGGRLADSSEFEGDLKDTKVNITLEYACLNKEHYDLIFRETQGAYLNKQGFFMEIQVPTYTELGIETIRGYFMSNHKPNCVATTEDIYYSTGDARYDIGGLLYDELHENVVFSFVQK